MLWEEAAVLSGQWGPGWLVAGQASLKIGGNHLRLKEEASRENKQASKALRAGSFQDCGALYSERGCQPLCWTMTKGQG